jgi:pimeloyl-ACP methyl ester carboxylesterase
MAATDNCPADGEYVFTILLHAIPTGQLFGSDAPFDEKLEISVNGERVALLDIDRWSSQADPDGLNIRTPRITVRAGPQRIAAALLKTFDGPVNDLIAPIGHSIADTQIGSELGITNMPHLSDLVVTGPYNPTGVADTPARRRIVSCRTTSPNEAHPCAEKIIADIGGKANRRPLTPKVVQALNDDPLIAHEVQPTRTVAAMVRADERLEKEFHLITLPVFILHGTEDKVTKPSGSQAFLDNAGSKDKALKLYEGYAHDLLNDIGKEVVLADIVAWIEARIPA